MFDNIPLFPIMLSLKVAGIGTLCAMLLALCVARFQARRASFVARLMDGFCTLPMVLPPTVMGYYLILVFGKKGFLGSTLASLGIELMFSWQGAVIAATVVIFPLIYKASRAALESVDIRYEQVARTLGASELKIFLLVSLPLAWRGILAGCMLAFARGVGEFGATLMIAGNIPYKTQTLSLAIYDAFQEGNDAEAFGLVLIASALCLTVLIVSEWLLDRWRGNYD